MPQTEPAPQGNGEAAHSVTNGMDTLSQMLLAYQRDLQTAMLTGDWRNVAVVQMQRQTELLNFWSQAVPSMRGMTGDNLRNYMLTALENWQKAADLMSRNISDQSDRAIETMKSVTRSPR